jgi:hypothetical protein
MLAISATILNPLIRNYIKTNPVMQHGLAATKDAKNPYKTNTLNSILPASQGIRPHAVSRFHMSLTVCIIKGHGLWHRVSIQPSPIRGSLFRNTGRTFTEKP